MSSININDNDINLDLNYDEIKRKKILSPFDMIKLSNNFIKNDSEKNRFYLYQQTNYLINNNPLMRKIFLNNYKSSDKIIIKNNNKNKNIPLSLRKKKLLTNKSLLNNYNNNSYKNYQKNK